MNSPPKDTYNHGLQVFLGFFLKSCSHFRCEHLRFVVLFFLDVFGGFLQCEIHDLHRCEVYAPTSHGASATCEPFIFRGDVRAFSTTPFFFGGGKQ